MSRDHHKPLFPGDGVFEDIPGGLDPAVARDAGERAAEALVRRTDSDDNEVASRLVRLAETEGLDVLAELWSDAAPTSLAGALWRLYLLRSWVYADPAGAAAEFAAGREFAPVADAVAGVPSPPGPDEVRALLDSVLTGVATSDFADTLFRASAFARVAATGRAHREQSHSADVSAAKLLTLANQLQTAGRLELAGRLGAQSSDELD